MPNSDPHTPNLAFIVLHSPAPTPTILVPLERLPMADNHLKDGRQGSNRATHAKLQIQAGNDLEAILAFLREYEASPGTHRIYQRECERLLLWALHAQQKPLSSLNRQDFEAYLDFMAHPEPHWCGPRRPRHSPDWKPFVGPLGDNAKITALAALNSLMTYLVDAGYLAGNPLGLIRQRRKKARQTSDHQSELLGLKVERFLDADMWQAVIDTVESWPKATPQEQAHYERARFMLALLMMLAPRASELQTHTMNSFREIRGRWWWYVLGKGQKAARVPVPEDMLLALRRYRIALGLTPLPHYRDTTPLLLSLDGQRGITARRLNQLLKVIFSQAAIALEVTLPHKAEKLRSASAHWGRHTSITEKLDSGIDRRLVQKLARHADARTTEIYLHDDDEQWHDESQKHRLRWKRQD